MRAASVPSLWLAAASCLVTAACSSSNRTTASGAPEAGPPFDDAGAGPSDAGGELPPAPGPEICPAPLAPPTATGCDGVQLTSAEAIEAQSEGVAASAGPGDAPGVRIGNGQSIDLRDEGCLQLGRDGSSFSLSLWLKATGDAQILGNTSQYGREQGFILGSKRRGDGDLELFVGSATADGPWKSVTSAPFPADRWVHVGLRYDNRDEGSRVTLTVNLQARSGPAAPDVYNADLRIGDQGWGDIDTFEISELTSYQRVLTDAELKALFLAHPESTGLSASELGEALAALSRHVEGDAPLGADALRDQAQRVVDHAALLETDLDLMKRALALVDRYEELHGPLFTTDATRQGIPREASADDDDARTLARAMLWVQQAILDHVFTPHTVEGCRSMLQGRLFRTSSYFPGAADPPADPSEARTVTISASLPAFWGRPVAFASDPVRRPTGLYLSPGSVAEVTVPQSMVNAGYTVLVGAHTADHSNKGTHKRLDRVTRSFPITRRVTYVANPLGGGIYIEVPYLADLGLVEVSVRGAIEAPFFSLKSFDTTTVAQWRERRTAPGPWADFETEKFMMQVPSSWIYAYDDPKPVLEAWDKAMDGVSELMGYPPEKRNRTVLYVQVDVQIRHGAFGIGYPQINNTYNPRATENGNKDHWLLTDPTKFEVEFHELGHAQLMSKFRGETEALVNFPHVYVRNVKFGVDFDQAFQQSMGPAHGDVGVKPDDAAIHWMATENFRNGREMDHSNTTKDQFRYQQRGYAKYADVVRLFGWQPLRDFYHQEHLDYMAGTPGDGLDPVDSRILRMSVAAQADLTPLIHFWGIHPVEPDKLKQALAAHGVPSSPEVRAHLERYKDVAPANNAEFNEHFERIYPGRPSGGNPDYGLGWYNVWRDQFDEQHAQQIQRQLQAIIDLYYP